MNPPSADDAGAGPSAPGAEELSWPQGTPIDVDPENAAAEMTLRVWVAGLAMSGALAGLASTSVGQSLLSVSPKWLLGAAALHAVIYTFNVFIVGPKRFMRPRFWPFRLLDAFASTTVAAVYGASSTREASAAHGALFVGAMIFADYYPQSWAVALGLVAIPPLLRWMSVPEASATSLAIALLMGCIAALFASLRSRAVVEKLRLRSAARATRALARAAHVRSASLSVAMSLHDGLSGMLYAARRRLATTIGVDELREIVAEILLRALRVVTPSRRGGNVRPSNLEEVLESLALAIGLSADVRVELATEAIDSGELADILDIGTELLANGAKHAPQRRIELHVRVAPARLTIVCRTEGATEVWERRGRGLRNAELRAQSRGGQLEVSGRGGRRELHIDWPRGAEPDRPRWWSVGEAAMLVVAMGPLLLTGSLWPSVVPVAAYGFCVFTRRHKDGVILRAREDLARAGAERQAAEGDRVLRLIEAACGPKLAALERAARTPSRDEACAAVDELSSVLADLLWAIEWSGSAAALEADARVFAREHRNLEASEARLAACTDPTARYELRRALRGSSASPSDLA